MRTMMARIKPTSILLASLLVMFAVGCGGDETPVKSTAETDTQTTDPDSGELTDDTGGTADVGGEEDAGGGEDAGTETDSGTADAGATDAGGDAGSEGDTSTTDAGDLACPGGDYCSCNSNDDCDKGFCIDSPDGKVCAESCVDTCKKDKFVCKLVPGPGGDNVTVCVPEGGNLCDPCDKNGQCTSLSDAAAACVDLGETGAFCGSSCKTDANCANGYECKDVKDVTGKDVKQCVVKGGGSCKCSKEAISKELSTKCFVTSGKAKCEGVRTCLPDGKQGAPAGGGLTACLAPTPLEEKCNGKDDDCDGDTDEATCDDSNDCTEDVCDKANGCKSTNKSGIACNADDSVCTKDDTCKDGKCEAGEKQTCDDKNPCTKDVCDPKDGCKYTNDDGQPCDADNTECTVNDKCKEGKCEAGEAKACKSTDQCVTGKCNITDGKCTYKFQEGQACNDGNPCTTGEKCTKGDCSGDATKCDDSNSCTADSCDKKTGCTHTAITSPCDDNDACTDKDVCKDKKCAGVKVNGAVKCKDDNECTEDKCDSVKGCINSLLTSTKDKPYKCDDGNPCTTPDACNNGSCKGGLNICTCIKNSDCNDQDDGNKCNGTLFCDTTAPPYKCKVDPKTIVKCNTSTDTFCAQTVCEPATGKCLVKKKTDGTACDADQSVCTNNDQCTGGVCTPGKNVNCNDKNVCTTDSCDPKAGCKFIANTNSCDADGDACTVDDICKEKSCSAGTKKKCDDGEACTENGCDKTSGKCTSKDLTKTCDDGSACTEGDKCGKNTAGKWTCIPGKGPDCNDNNPCTKDTCEVSGGCKNTVDSNITVPCYSADPKTKDKGICKAGGQKCDSQGKLGKCIGEVTPAAKEICGDNKDNTCSGVKDDGCAPTGYQARFGNGVVNGSVTLGGKKYDARLFVGGSNAVGTSKGTKHTADFGFYAWVKALLGK
ncbi:MAG: hypothetical protein KC502_05915 [Myxococcales bacterium]|nr:hypothetical protein [Myxococcales bacterium]